jgi:DNA-binding response OmpR family regulator
MSMILDGSSFSPRAQAPALCEEVVGTTASGFVLRAMTKTVLIAGEDARTAASIRELLAANEFEAEVVESGAEALALLGRERFDVVILDLGLRDISGLEVLRQLGQTRSFGLIAISGRTDPVDVVVGLELGADDYITKPFDPRELLARVRSVVRRCGPQPAALQEPGETFAFPGWSFDTARRIIVKAGTRPVKLTAGEVRLLTILITYPNRILTRDRLLDLLHPNKSDIPFDRSIDVTITRLRRKIERDARRPTFIKTARGDGYVFDPLGGG